MAKMGLGSLAHTCYLRRFRWSFHIDNTMDDRDGPLYALFPLKGGRPHITFKEIEIPHVYENIYFYGKPEWKPLQITLYEHKTIQRHPVFDWLLSFYDCGYGGDGYFRPADQPHNNSLFTVGSVKKNATLTLWNGCGEPLERWDIQNCWPQQVNFGELDMGNSEVVTCEVHLRYDRALRIDL